MDALAADHDFLLASDIFSRELIADWREARLREHHAVQTRPHPYEMQMYFDV
jgi:glutamine synthetase